MATKLLTMRKARQISLSTLSAAVNLTRGQLSRIERGHSRPSAKSAERLYEYFAGAISREELMFSEFTHPEAKKPVASVEA